MQETIQITIEEYKELLTIKGKYEELKEHYMPRIYPTTIKYTGETFRDPYEPYTVTCGSYESDSKLKYKAED